MATLKFETRKRLYDVLDALEEESLAEVEVRTITGQSPELVVGPTELFEELCNLGDIPGISRSSLTGDSFGGWTAHYFVGDLEIISALRGYPPSSQRGDTPPSSDEAAEVQRDEVNHPSHYASESGLEAIEVIEAFFHGNAFLANTFKYIARAGKKGGEAKRLEDLRKARWYLEREIKREEAREDS